MNVCVSYDWGIFLRVGYTGLESSIASHAHEESRSHQQHCVRVPNRGLFQWLWKLHYGWHSGSVLYDYMNLRLHS